MTKVVRQTYQKDVSLGILAIIFALTFLLSGQLFESKQPDLGGILNIYFAESLVSLAVVIMVIILWEELLFSVKVKPDEDGLVFRNHQTKLWIQGLIYIFIPVIIVYLYLTFNVSAFRFFSWAAVCMGLPIVGKLVSGINNYNDYLKIHDDSIEYKNNEKEGVYQVDDILSIVILKDAKNGTHKIQLTLNDDSQVIIDLDEMELEEFYETIEEYMFLHYKDLIKQ